MIETRLMELSDKEKIEQLRHKYKHLSASHAFASLYIWKETLGLSLYIEDELFAVKSLFYGENAWVFPCGSDEAICNFINRATKDLSIEFCYMREEDVTFLNNYFPNRFEIMESPNENEYLYSAEEQKALVGKKFAKLRNHISKVNRDYTLTVKPFDTQNVEFAKGIITNWEQKPHEKSVLGLSDESASELLITSAKELDVSGIVVYVNDVPFAIVIGYPISENSFDMCLAKQNDTLSGLSVYAKHEFICSLPPCYKIINAEDDLGIEGLRTLKQQMQPIGQVKMFSAKLKSNPKL
ncbi:MAG: phosphatidylglycerol lysyltransferase domain-containing protein [Oscillospiraceae bacterium]